MDINKLLKPVMGPWTGGVTAAPAKPQHIEVYTDGGFDANFQALGTWAFLVRSPHAPLAACEYKTGYLRQTTNNRMELLAAIEALEHVEIGPRTILTSDSEYVVKGTSWVDGWINKGWMTGGGTPVKNKDLWERMVVLRDLHNVRFDWVKGHAGNPFNEACDKLCQDGKAYARGLMKKDHSLVPLDEGNAAKWLAEYL